MRLLALHSTVLYLGHKKTPVDAKVEGRLYVHKTQWQRRIFGLCPKRSKSRRLCQKTWLNLSLVFIEKKSLAGSEKLLNLATELLGWLHCNQHIELNSYALKEVIVHASLHTAAVSHSRGKLFRLVTLRDNSDYCIKPSYTSAAT